MCASYGIKLIDCCRESLSSDSSSLDTAVSTRIMKMGLRLAVWLGRMYSMVVKSGISSAGSCWGAMC